MAGNDNNRFMDAVAWGGNVSTSVAIIFINKILMSSTGYGFRYGETAAAMRPNATHWHSWTLADPAACARGRVLAP